MKTSENLIVKLTFEFALQLIVYTEELEKRKKFNLANQLFRAGTSIGANVNEAQNCESRADFVHKIKVAAKEAEETKYWLNLCINSEHYPDPGKLIDDLMIIIKILNKIIGTAKLVKAH
jgi:four helix bundle protein